MLSIFRSDNITRVQYCKDQAYLDASGFKKPEKLMIEAIIHFFPLDQLRGLWVDDCHFSKRPSSASTPFSQIRCFPRFHPSSTCQWSENCFNCEVQTLESGLPCCSVLNSAKLETASLKLRLQHFTKIACVLRLVSDIPVDMVANIFREKTVPADDMNDLPGVCF